MTQGMKETPETNRPGLHIWLRTMVDDGQCPGVEWDNKAQGAFRIPWRNQKSRHWDEADSKIFMEYARHTGKYKDGEDTDFPRWKQNLKSAINKNRFIERLRHLDQLSGPKPHRIYRFIQEDISDVRYDRPGVTTTRKDAATMCPIAADMFCPGNDGNGSASLSPSDSASHAVVWSPVPQFRADGCEERSGNIPELDGLLGDETNMVRIASTLKQEKPQNVSSQETVILQLPTSSYTGGQRGTPPFDHPHNLPATTPALTDVTEMDVDMAICEDTNLPSDGMQHADTQRCAEAVQDHNLFPATSVKKETMFSNGINTVPQPAIRDMTQYQSIPLDMRHTQISGPGTGYFAVSTIANQTPVTFHNAPHNVHMNTEEPKQGPNFPDNTSTTTGIMSQVSVHGSTTVATSAPVSLHNTFNTFPANVMNTTMPFDRCDESHMGYDSGYISKQENPDRQRRAAISNSDTPLSHQHCLATSELQDLPEHKPYMSSYSTMDTSDMENRSEASGQYHSVFNHQIARPYCDMSVPKKSSSELMHLQVLYGTPHYVAYSTALTTEQPSCRIFYGQVNTKPIQEAIKGPEGNLEIELPKLDDHKLIQKKAGKVQELLDYLECGIVISYEGDNIYAERRCRPRVFYSDGVASSQALARSSLKRRFRTKIFDYESFKLALMNHEMDNENPVPRDHVLLTIGCEILPNDDSPTRHVPIYMVVRHVGAARGRYEILGASAISSNPMYSDPNSFDRITDLFKECDLKQN